MNFDNVRFTKEHEWIRVEDSSNLATVGITDYAAGELGDVVFVELPTEGTVVKTADSIGTIEAVKTVADLYTPVSGVVKQSNGGLEEDPGLVNRSPYDEGWFLKIEMPDRSEFEALMSHEDYKKLIGKE